MSAPTLPISAKPRKRRFDWGTAGFVTTLLAPGLLLYGLLVIWPMLQSFYVAVHRWRGVSGRMVFIGPENFVQLVQDERFRAALFHNVLFFVMAAISVLTLALFFANALAQKLKGVELFRALFLFPNVVSIVAVSTLWMFLYNPNWGLVNAVIRGFGDRDFWWTLRGLLAVVTLGWAAWSLRSFSLSTTLEQRVETLRAVGQTTALMLCIGLVGLWSLEGLLRPVARIDVTWLADQRTVLPAVAATYVWYVLGFYILLFRAGIQNISADVNEAATIDGTTGTQRFWFVTLPLLNPILRLSVIYLIINSMNLFALIWIMAPPSGTAGATEVALTYLYQKGFEQQQFGYATAIGAVNFVIVMVVTTVLQRVWKVDE